MVLGAALRADVSLQHLLCPDVNDHFDSFSSLIHHAQVAEAACHIGETWWGSSGGASTQKLADE